MKPMSEKAEELIDKYLNKQVNESSKLESVDSKAKAQLDSTLYWKFIKQQNEALNTFKEIMSHSNTQYHRDALKWYTALISVNSWSLGVATKMDAELRALEKEQG
jgi:hypothetical protein